MESSYEEKRKSICNEGNVQNKNNRQKVNTLSYELKKTPLRVESPFPCKYELRFPRQR